MNKKQLRALYMAVFTVVLVGGMFLVNNQYNIPLLKEYPYLFAIGFLIAARLIAQFLVRNKPDED